MNYQPVVTGNQPNDNLGIQENLDAGKVGKETVSGQQYVLLPLWSTGSQDPQNSDAGVADAAFDVKENEEDVHVSPSCSDKLKKHDEKYKRDDKGKSPVDISIGVRDLRADPSDTAVSLNFRIVGKSSFVDPSKYLDDPDIRELEDIVYSDDEEDVGVEANFSNLETNIFVSPIPTTRVHKDHPLIQIIGDLTLAPQTKSIGRMGQTQEEGIDYDEVFAPVTRIEAIWLFLAYASFMGFMVYQMDVKSAFLYETIKEETVVATLSSEAEYVAAASCCSQVLWIKN
nr:putative ribonuclease H-like domain-containing protein [Tanacetum cinerariifolium]